MAIIRMSWFLLAIILLGLAFNNSVSEARHLKKVPSALVVGTVYCDTCFQEEFSKASHFISGALVAVECRGSSSEPSFREEVETDENGEFKVHLPFSVHKHEKKIKACSVMLINSSEPHCAVASTAPSSSFFNLKSKKHDPHIFSAGFYAFKPLKQPSFCNQNPKELSSKKFSTPSANHLKPSKLSNSEVSQQQFLPPLPLVPPFGLPLPPNPFLPPPSILPPNPFLPPPSILPPNPFQPPPSILPPNPFQPPPSILPPNPFRPPPSILPPIPGLTPPQPPPSILPPIPGLTPPQPPPSIFPPITFPPIPGLTPSPPPPPPSIFPPIHFPPIPGLTPSPPAFPIPIPPFPGIPPASSSKDVSP